MRYRSRNCRRATQQRLACLQLVALGVQFSSVNSRALSPTESPGPAAERAVKRATWPARSLANSRQLSRRHARAIAAVTYCLSFVRRRCRRLRPRVIDCRCSLACWLTAWQARPLAISSLPSEQASGRENRLPFGRGVSPLTASRAAGELAGSPARLLYTWPGTELDAQHQIGAHYTVDNTRPPQRQRKLLQGDTEKQMCALKKDSYWIATGCRLPESEQLSGHWLAANQ